jgi:hypothetical protein
MDEASGPADQDGTDVTAALREEGAETSPFFGTEPHGTAPSTAHLYDELARDLERNQARADGYITEPEKPPYIAGTIDVAEFLKALARFNLMQAHFLRSGRSGTPDHYLHSLQEYSQAQDDYIRALSTVLHQLGVI